MGSRELELPTFDHELAQIEEEVCRHLFRGDDNTLAILREQYKNARVNARQRTGVGFYTTWTVPANVPRVTGNPNLTLGKLSGSAANVKNGVGFVLFVKAGALHMLEGYTFDEPWPERLIDFRVGDETAQ